MNIEGQTERCRARCAWPGSGLQALSLATMMTVAGIFPAAASDEVGHSPYGFRVSGDKYSLLGESYLFRTTLAFSTKGTHHGDDWGVGTLYFGRVSVDTNQLNGTDALTYAVEGHRDPVNYRHCHEPGCYHVAVGVRPRNGLLYTYMHEDPPPENPRKIWTPTSGSVPLPGYEARVEVSVDDAEAQTLILRDVLVQSSPDAPECSDYPVQDVDRYVCQYKRELLTAERPETPDSYRRALPGLVQDPENYDLVLSEDFEGDLVDSTGDCENGMINLDGAVWNYDADPCNDVDADGVPCYNIRNGYFEMAKTRRCFSTLNTWGKFSYRYGYLETQYIVQMVRQDGWVNMAFVQWAGARGGRGIESPHRLYGVEIDGYEAQSKYYDLEIDHIEFIPGNVAGRDHFHQYVNAFTKTRHAAVVPRRTDKSYSYCRRNGGRHDYFIDVGDCNWGRELRITKGVEWTPRGYRTFLKVHGVNDEFEVIGERFIGLKERPVLPSSEGPVTFADDWKSLDSDRRQRYFEYLEDGNPASILEQFGIAHMPADFEITAWGYPRDGSTNRFKLEYVRVYQPRNRYADMEPVYE